MIKKWMCSIVHLLPEFATCCFAWGTVLGKTLTECVLQDLKQATAQSEVADLLSKEHTPSSSQGQLYLPDPSAMSR
jgi:hypothetical protein